MKLKNKLLSIFSILLLSCQYTPAYAQVVDNNLNAVGVELTLCESIAVFAEDVSNARQNGVSYEVAISVAPAPTTQAEEDIKLILDEITYAAYQFPIYKDQEDKIEISERFSSVIYNVCNGRK